MSGEAIDTRTRAIRRGSGHGTSEGWFVVTGGDPSGTRVAASASHQAMVTAGVGLVDKLNRSLRGWSNYFGYGSRSKAYRSVDHYGLQRLPRAVPSDALR
jgi:Group II intron, maturase-specific domain